jgi:hypothetical protein
MCSYKNKISDSKESPLIRLAHLENWHVYAASAVWRRGTSVCQSTEGFGGIYRMCATAARERERERIQKAKASGMHIEKEGRWRVVDKWAISQAQRRLEFFFFFKL